MDTLSNWPVRYKDLLLIGNKNSNVGVICHWTLKEIIAKDLDNLIYVSVTEGVGGGIIINKSIYKGRSKRAGEIGHMTINKAGRLCNCGKRGCWETYASVRAIINDYNTESSYKATSIDDVMEKYKNNEETAVKVVNLYIENLAEGIQNLVFIFSPDYIVVGGDMSKYSGLFLDKVVDKVFDKNEFYSRSEVNILFSQLGEDSNILGASLIPIVENFRFEKI